MSATTVGSRFSVGERTQQHHQISNPNQAVVVFVVYIFMLVIFFPPFAAEEQAVYYLQVLFQFRNFYKCTKRPSFGL